MDKIVVPISINGIFLSGIIDTGAEYTLLSTRGARKARLFYYVDKNTKDKVRGVSEVTKVYGYLPR